MVAWRSSVARNVVNIPERRERVEQQLAALEALDAGARAPDHSRRVLQLRNRLDELEVWLLLVCVVVLSLRSGTSTHCGGCST